MLRGKSHKGCIFFKLSQRFGKLKCHGLINYIDTKAKCRHLKILTCQGTLRHVFICLRPPSLLGFCLGWSSNFVGSESGQIQSVKSGRIWFSTGQGGELNQREG
jgi:hypothetical protein